MDKHFDVAVLGVWFGANYGSLLNGYATYKILKSFGCSVLMVNKPNASANDWEIVNPHCSAFISKFYDRDDISALYPYARMRELNDLCDTFLIGSDQIWHYHLIKGFNNSFLLNFADDDKKKISFGTSFGHKNNTVPPEMMPEATRLFQRFHAISVREQSSADILKDVYKVKSTVTAEPVFCLERKEYEEIAACSDFEIKEPYILSYILDPTQKIIETIEYYCNLTGMKSINILDGDPFHNKKMREIFTLPNTPEEPGAEDLVKLYQNAAFVITDSFHGTCFSIIFEKPFLAIANYMRGVARFSDLLTKYGLLDRLAMDVNDIPKDEKFLLPVDYTKIREQIAEERVRSIAWLKNAIETPKDKLPSIVLPQNTVEFMPDRKMCTGCSACVNTCPVHAISLVPDEHGYYRSRIDYERCIGCGMCARICPAIHLPENLNERTPELYVLISKDENVLWNSSSGGAFPLLAERVLEKNGCVVGAAWKDDFTVEHIMIENSKDLIKLQKSKYLQSYMGDIYSKTKEKLEENQFVLFSACPCQIAGLKAFLGKSYDNLIAVDLLCGNAPSAMFFQKYLQDSFPEGVAKYEFRHKVNGWTSDCTTTTTTTTTGLTVVRRGGKQDSYQRVYHNHTMCPPHCEKCRYQSLPRFGDLTIGDFWGIEQKDRTIDVKKGVSAVLCNNTKGRELFLSIAEEKVAVRKKVPLTWLGGNGYTNWGGHNYSSPKRDLFYETIKTMPFSQAVTYALKPNHGIYPKEGIFEYRASAAHFTYDPSIWQEDYINGKTVLTTKFKRPGIGNYCVLPLRRMLDADKEYLFTIKCKIVTESSDFNFHVKDSGSRLYQVIYNHKVTAENRNKWVELKKVFTPDCGFYDEFMIGAAQLRGEERFIAIDCLSIEEWKS